jgi:hypothetical protein
MLENSWIAQIFCSYAALNGESFVGAWPMFCDSRLPANLSALFERAVFTCFYRETNT